MNSVRLNNIEPVSVVCRVFDRRAEHYDDAAEVIRQVGGRLLKRLDYLTVQPAIILDLGCGTGALLPLLRQRYRRAQLIGIDASAGMLRLADARRGRWRRATLLQADAHHLPLQDASVDMVVSNLLLPWAFDPAAVLVEVQRVLKPGGVLMFTAVGPDTLQEYLNLRPEPQTRQFGLIDMHALGDALVAAGFSDPVLDRENLWVDYPSVMDAEKELRAVGAINLSQQRPRGLLTRKMQQQTTNARPGRFKVTLELIQGQAWKTALPSQSVSETGSTTISFAAFRQSLRARK